MTIAELQALIMRQAIAKLERLRRQLQAMQARQAEQAAAAEPGPARRMLTDDYLVDEIDAQELLIAKLTYQHEREQAELDRVDAANALAREEIHARIAELEHLTKHRDAVLAAFQESNRIAEANGQILEAAIVQVAEAIEGQQ